MDIITQDFIGRRIVYHHKHLNASGRSTQEDLYDCPIKVKVIKGTRMIFILDSDGRVRTEPTHYVNDTRVTLPFGSRRQIASALSLFYTFCDIMQYDPEHLTYEKVEDFINFLAGYTVQDEPGAEPHVYRSPKTVNGYYGMVKRFVKIKGWPMEAYSHYQETRVYGPAGGEFNIERIARKDTHTLRSGTIADRSIPKHITPSQMKALASLMQENHDMTALVVSHLQYSYGLRSGEALGLTREDIVSTVADDGIIQHKLILRNRISDRLDQSCKGLFHPTTPKMYKTSSYFKSRHEIDITEGTYRQLTAYMAYLNQYKATAKQTNNYKSDTVADTVDGVVPINRYIFVGRNGKRLSGQTWNNRLGRYFLQVGIELDEGAKHSNCSHRLRHGFAMFHAQYSKTPMSIMELQRALRHASPTTCAIYYTPLPEEERKLKESFQKEIEKLIPEFTYAEN